MSNVRALPPSEPDPYIIAALEAALEKAKAGEVQDMAVVCLVMGADGPAIWAEFHGERHFAALLGGVEMLKHDMMRDLDE